MMHLDILIFIADSYRKIDYNNPISRNIKWKPVADSNQEFN